MPDDSPPYVEVDRDIYDGLAEFRASADPHFDVLLRDVVDYLRQEGDDETADWVADNPGAYARGVSQGFYARPRSGLPLLRLTDPDQTIIDDSDD